MTTTHDLWFTRQLPAHLATEATTARRAGVAGVVVSAVGNQRGAFCRLGKAGQVVENAVPIGSIGDIGVVGGRSRRVAVQSPGREQGALPSLIESRQ